MIEKVFDAERDLLHDVLAFTEGELEKHDCNPKTLMMISIMVEEIDINIASYAYKGMEKGKAIISMDFDGDTMWIQFVDTGAEFNPLAKEDPDITLAAEDRDIGGLGIYMVKQTMEDVKYERKDGKNIFSFRKNIR